jgi:hypothetical protein
MLSLWFEGHGMEAYHHYHNHHQLQNQQQKQQKQELCYVFGVTVYLNNILLEYRHATFIDSTPNIHIFVSDC